MLTNIKYTDTQISKIIKTAQIVVDNREQNCQKILDYFDKKGIKYVRRSLDFGDYSIQIPQNDDLGVPFLMSFEKNFVVELKHSGSSGLDELAGNFTTDRLRFETEFIKSMPFGCKVFLVVGGGSWDDIDEHKYRTQFEPKSFYNSLLSWRFKYGFGIDFIKEEKLGQHIYRTLIVALKKKLEE